MRLVLLAWVLCCTWRGLLAVTIPPGIFMQPSYNVFYKTGETVEMPCVAYGKPNIRYTWQRNGQEFTPSGNSDRVVQLPNSGTLVFNKPEDKDEGIFQCFASNTFGVSATININFREAKLKQFNTEDDITHYPSLGHRATLNCVPPESIPPPEVFWVFKDQDGGIEPINFDSRVTMDHESRLRITNVEAQDDQGGRAYACMAMNTFVRDNTQGARQFIVPQGTIPEKQPVTYFWASPSDHFGLKDRPFKIKCIFAGNPTPDVHWTRPDGKPLPDYAQEKSFGQELAFERLDFSDEGTYECWATNDHSQTRVQRTINIRVESTPYWTEEPKDVELGVGGTARFRCQANGAPEPSIFWFVNAVPLGEVTDPRIDKRFRRISPEEVIFENVTREDAMVIQCNVTNKHGYIWGDVYLNVLSEAPTIMVPPDKVMVVAEGQSVSLPCRTAGKPDPQITWFKEGQQITGGRYRTLFNGDLFIEAVVLADAGYFLCSAQNIYGGQNASGILMVRRKTQIEQRPFDLEVNAHQDAKFTCSGTTDPEEVQNLKIKWMKDNKDITANDQRMTMNNQDNSLTISGTIVRDSGTYTCIATNGLDNATASAFLTVKDRPEAPVSVERERCEKLNATIRWTPGAYNNAPVQYFIVQYNTSEAKDKWIFATKVPSEKTTTNVTLSPNATYTFRVLAYNKIGESDPSFPTLMECKTQPARPYKNPENLRTIGDRLNYLHIEWTPMPKLQQNGPGFQYILQYKRKGDAESTTVTDQIDNATLGKKEFPTGNVYTAYEITLKAENSQGEAMVAAKTITGFSGEDVPSDTTIPTDFQVIDVDSDSAQLSWNFEMSAVDNEVTPLNGEFRGFKVQVWRRNQRERTIREWDISPEEVEEQRVGNMIYATLNNLLSFTDLEARVAVMNNFYVGRPTDIISFKTLEGVPGPVEFFRVRSIGDNHVNLEWGKPLDENGEITGYDIGYQSVTGLDLGKMQEREPQINNRFQTSELLSGLMPNSKYRVFIWARTAIGRGDSYFIELKTTLPGNPEAPRFTIQDVGPDFINVTWWVNPYSRSGTVIYVEYRRDGAPEWLHSTDEVVNMWKNISGLESGTTYDVRVAATNSEVRTVSNTEKVRTTGFAAASALSGNYIWFTGLILALIIIIIIIVLVYCMVKRGFEFNIGGSDSGRTRSTSYPTYTGINTAQIPRQRSSEFGPEPKGYNNDYYDDRDRDSYYDYDRDRDSMHRSQTSLSEKRPPSYYSDRDRYSAHYDDDDDYDRDRDTYEDYERKPSYRDDYSDEEQQPSRDSKPPQDSKPPPGSGPMSSFV